LVLVLMLKTQHLCIGSSAYVENTAPVAVPGGGGEGSSPDDFDDCKRAQDKPTSLRGNIRLVLIF
jgi:hypothetical protein